MRKIHILLGLSLLLCSCTTKCNHQYNSIVTNPTCSKDGYTTHTCEFCGHKYIDSYVDALGHDYVLINVKQPTYDEDGCIEHYGCSRCSDVFNLDKNKVSLDDVTTRLSIYDYSSQKDPVFLIHGETEINYDRELTGEFFDYAETTLTAIKTTPEKLTNEDIDRLISNIDSYGTVLYNNYVMAYINSCVYGRAEDYDLLTEIYSYFKGAEKCYYSALAAILNSSFASYKYPNYTKEQCEYYAQLYESYASDELNEYDTEINRITSDFKAGKIDCYNALIDFVDASNSYAQGYGFNHYLDYAYQYKYYREYTIDDVNDISTTIKATIVPLYQTYKSYLENFENKSNEDSLDGQKYKEAIDKSNAFSNEFFGQYLKEMEDYNTFLGDSYINSYKAFFETGSFYLTNKVSNLTGFCSVLPDKTPYMLLAKGYQTIRTFIHEFGHYYSFTSFGTDATADIQEVHSQGNELLFYSFLLQNNYFDELTGKYFIANQILSILEEIIIGFAMNELEFYVYTTDNLTKEDIDNKWSSICADYGRDSSSDGDYVYKVMIMYQSYYISYSTSAIASLEIFAKSLSDIADAKNSYLSIQTKDSSTEMFMASLQNAGLFSIFGEDAYDLINSISSLVN